MPLVRIQIRNEYGYGSAPELYGSAPKDDPKAVLDGVTVTGLVGILRQLGDLVEFASVIFHDLHEEVMTTSVRGSKLLTRIQHLERTLPSCENAIQGQRSHMQFSYVPGSDWHAEIKTTESHLLSSDLPQFMMDSYEECLDPPRLYLLDKFDNAGTGACLKKYSDPSFFRRQWVTTELDKAKKIQKEKKSQKIKRQGSKIKNGEIHDGGSLSRRHSSVRFDSPITDEQHFPTEVTSNCSMKLQLEDASRSTSFGSRTRLNYTEQLPDTNSSEISDEVDFDRPTIPKLKMNQSGSFASSTLDKLNGVTIYSGSPHGSLDTRSARRSRSVTWDEKTEILRVSSPTSCHNILADGTGYLEPLHASSRQSKMESEATKLGSVHQQKNMFGAANVQAKSSNVNHFAEVTTETDNYMDALNTLEPENETDSECLARREVKAFSNFSHSQLDESERSQMQEMASISSDISGIDSISGSYSFSNEYRSPITHSFMPSESLKPVHSPYSNGFPDHSIGNQHFEQNHVCMPRKSSFEGFEDDRLPESRNHSSPEDLGPETTAYMSKLQDSAPVNNYTIPTPNFWTNGGLLGLAPSKPPDFNISEEKKIHGSLNAPLNNSSLSGDQQFTKSDNLVPEIDPSQCSPCYLDDQLDDMQVNQNYRRRLRALPSSESEKIQVALPCIISAQEGCDITVPKGDESPSCNTAERQPKPNGFGQNTMDIASSLSVLAQRILSNGVQIKPSITQAQFGKSNADSGHPQDTSILNRQDEGSTEVVSEPSYAENINNAGSISSKNSILPSLHLSGHSSPPLEHMRFSFHPINGSETSNLKLDFATVNHDESTEDMTFPSFQLCPGSNIPLEDNGSDTDDSFNRSCPYTSEDHLSPRSDSNSELWRQHDMSGGTQEMYNDLHRVLVSSSSVSSFKGFNQVGQVNTDTGVEKSETQNNILFIQNGNSGGLPGLDWFISRHDEAMSGPFSINPESSACQSQNERPPLPPLPPMQWRTKKASFDFEEQKDNSVPKIVDQFNILQGQRFTAYQQQVPKIASPPPFPKTTAFAINKSCGGQELNGHKETRNSDVKSLQQDQRDGMLYQIRNKRDQQNVNAHKEHKVASANCQGLDEREDLLQQIRNKAFNLRRTSAAKTSNETQQITNINIASILKKANAIRKVHWSSEDGDDDDNWTDS